MAIRVVEFSKDLWKMVLGLNYFIQINLSDNIVGQTLGIEIFTFNITHFVVRTNRKQKGKYQKNKRKQSFLKIIDSLCCPFVDCGIFDDFSKTSFAVRNFW